MGEEELQEHYFLALSHEAFSDATDRLTYEGVLRVLHDIPFYWTMWLDENRAGDALFRRQNEFLGGIPRVDWFDSPWLHDWAASSPSVLEVLLGMAHRWSMYFEGDVSFYFWHMFSNMQFDHYPGRSLASTTQQRIRARVDQWLSRQFQPDGQGSPFPVDNQRVFDVVDMRQLDIIGQMNAYSSVHFQ